VPTPKIFIERAPMRIGITGSTGFIGSHLIKTLRELLPDTEITTLKRSHPDRSPKVDELRHFVHDLDLIYHIGGVNRGTNEEVLRGNIESTFNLLEAVNKFGKPVPRIVFTSSSQVYKSVEQPGKLIDESYKTEPTTLFGVAKKTAEDLIRLSGFEYVIMRIANIYGPGCHPEYNSVIATFCHKSANGKPLMIDGNGHQSRDFIYIEDVIKALVLAGTKNNKPAFEIYNIGTSQTTSLRQVIQNIKASGVEVKETYTSKVSVGQNSFSLDSSLFKKHFEWNPKTKLCKGIENTLAWFQESVTS
jgi:UDP-glucose 4-epimerase